MLILENDAKFEPTLSVPALQFLEDVERDSNAEKAGLKVYDFVLEVDTCIRHMCYHISHIYLTSIFVLL